MIHDREDLDDDAMLDEGEEASVVDEVEASEGHGLDGVSGAVDLEVDDESDLTGLTADLEADEDSSASAFGQPRDTLGRRCGGADAHSTRQTAQRFGRDRPWK